VYLLAFILPDPTCFHLPGSLACVTPYSHVTQFMHQTVLCLTLSYSYGILSYHIISMYRTVPVRYSKGPPFQTLALELVRSQSGSVTVWFSSAIQNSGPWNGRPSEWWPGIKEHAGFEAFMPSSLRHTSEQYRYYSNQHTHS